jgi:hypothetical protein
LSAAFLASCNFFCSSLESLFNIFPDFFTSLTSVSTFFSGSSSFGDCFFSGSIFSAGAITFFLRRLRSTITVEPLSKLFIGFDLKKNQVLGLKFFSWWCFFYLLQF